MTEKLTDEQVENWRAVLSVILGPYAFLMSREQIRAWRDKTQAEVDRLSENIKSE